MYYMKTFFSGYIVARVERTYVSKLWIAKKYIWAYAGVEAIIGRLWLQSYNQD